MLINFHRSQYKLQGTETWAYKKHSVEEFDFQVKSISDGLLARAAYLHLKYLAINDKVVTGMELSSEPQTEHELSY